MALIKDKINSKSPNLIEKSEIICVCPICKTSKSLEFPYSIINDAKQLTTISLPKGLICNHHFQAFVDKNLNVRGYQKVDYEFRFDSNSRPNAFHDKQIELDDELFQSLILEGNYVEYNLRKLPKINYLDKVPESSKNNSEHETLKKIYEEFWEFIDDDNIEFKKFIERDIKRRKDRGKIQDLK